MDIKSLDITAEKLTQLRILFPEAFSEGRIDYVRLAHAQKRGLVFGGIVLIALLAFEVFNYSSTSFALNDILGDLSFGPLRWATILAFAFCLIDFAGIARIFTPEEGRDEPAEVWYLFAAWFLAATFNASLTWWGISVAMSAAGIVPFGQTSMIKIVPVFIATMVLVIRVLLINTFAIAGERIFNIQEFGTALKNLSGSVSTLDPTNVKPSSEAEETEISFTAYYPKEGKAETWYTLFVYTHLLSAVKDVQQDARRFGGQLSALREVKSTSSTRITRGTEITVVPVCNGITFNPKKLSFEWMEDYHHTEFRFRADKSLEDDVADGYIDFYVGPVIIGSLKFAMLFSSSVDRSVAFQEEQSVMYHNDKIFLSYSHKDSEIVLAFKKVHKATGYQVLIDTDNLRSGQEWDPELMSLIDHADIFQLFWSENSKNSKYCQQEWKHALKRNIEGFVRPIYWQKPIPNPPRQLKKYHFAYVELENDKV